MGVMLLLVLPALPNFCPNSPESVQALVRLAILTTEDDKLPALSIMLLKGSINVVPDHLLVAWAYLCVSIECPFFLPSFYNN